MTALEHDATLADVVNANPATARVLERHGLDYCCGGQRTLAAACTDAGLDPEAVLDEIRALAPAAVPGWATAGPAELVNHLEATHHAYLHTELGRLAALVDKVADAHGERHPELAAVGATFEELRAELEPHLQKEEHVLFPMIRELASSANAPTFHCGSLANPISVMMREHDRAGELLERLRELTHGFVTPDDGCASYRALDEGLAQLEADTHLHVHKENNVLFPAVLELETRGRAGAAEGTATRRG